MKNDNNNNKVNTLSPQDLIDNYRKAYDAAKEAAVAAAQVSMPPLLEMEALWKERNEKS